MSFEWYVARRYLVARRRQAFISLTTAVSILGVGVGVMALIIALALMTGVQRELRDRIVGSTAHVYVYKIGDGFDDLDAEIRRVTIPGVSGAAPGLLGLGLLTSDRADAVPVQLKGIDPAREPGVTDIGTAMRAGSLEALTARGPDAADGVILGADLAETLGVEVGDSVVVYTSKAVIMPGYAGATARKLEVVGTAGFGFFDVDSGQGFVTMKTAQQIFGRSGPDLIQLRVADLDDAPRIRETLQDQLGAGYQVRDWTELNQPLYSALWLEKVAISLTIGLIVIVAALQIVASLVLLVMEKSRDIAILRTMGARARAIRRIFVYQGLAIGLIGTIAGTTLGLIVCVIADRYKLIKLQADVYQIAYIPFRIEVLDVAIVVVSAIAVCLIATIYPSRQAGRLDPAEALRNL